MSMPKAFLVSLVVACVTLSMGSMVSASLIANGDFEAVTGGQFDSWTYQALGDASDETTSVISGAHSAEVTGRDWAYMEQTLSGFDPNMMMSWDFATFAGAPDERTAQFRLKYSVNEVWMRVQNTGGTLNLEVHDGTDWQPRFIVNPTIDDNGDGLWTSETPIVNHLVFSTHDYNTASASYDVSLNGVTVSGLTGVTMNPGDPTTITGMTFQLNGHLNAANFLIDNVITATVPEPSALALFASAMVGLLAYAWRKRR